MERWFWIDIGYACFGIAFLNARCTKAAPIAAWMIGKTSDQIRPFLKKHKAKIIELSS